jgi:hypothetical protein
MSITQVHNFHGLLLKKVNKYVCSKDCDEAFKTLKKLLTTSLVLA